MDRPELVWIGVIVVGLVFLDLLFVEVRRIVREAKRIVRRLDGYTQLPLFDLMAVSGGDAERIALAVDALPPLIERAQSALETLRLYRPKGSSPG